jgi:hypothetical protein
MKRPDPTYYVTVRNGRVERRSTALSGTIHVFGQDAATAILQNDTIIVTLKNGRVAECPLTATRTAAVLVTMVG